MDIRPLSEDYAVTPQILPEDVPAIAEAGFSVVICNRPDGEIPNDINADAMRALVEGAGMAFVVNPFHPGALTMENVQVQRDAIDAANGKILAYCASGNRSSILWALALAGRKPTDEMIAACTQYGYQTAQFRDLIEKLAQDA